MSSKYDCISDEILIELYINQNLPISVVAKKLNGSKTQIRLLLIKRGIIKSKELRHQQYTNTLNEFYANRTEEQYLHKSRACKDRWNNSTEEEKIEWMKPLNKVNAHRSPEHEAALIKSYKNFLKNESKEDRAIRLENIRISTTKAIKNMSPETKAKASEKRKNTWNNKTEDEKRKIKEKRQKTMSAKSLEEKSSYIEKGRLTKLKNGTLFTSNDENIFINYLNELGYKTSKFYLKEHINTTTKSEIDIYIDEQKLGIEINGIYFHSINGKNHRDKYYHYNKTEDARLNNFSLIHLWEDWIHTNLETCKNILFNRLDLSHTKTLDTLNYIQINQNVFEDLRKNFTLDYSKTYANMYKVMNNTECYAILGLNIKDRIIEFNLFENPLYKISNLIQSTIKFIINTFNPNKIYTSLMRDIYIADNYLNNSFVLVNYTEPNRFLIKGNYQRFYTDISVSELKNQENTNNIFECYGSGYIKLEYKE